MSENIYYSNILGKQVFATKKCEQQDVVDFFRAIKKIPSNILNYLIKNNWVLCLVSEEEMFLLTSSSKNSFTNSFRKFIVTANRPEDSSTIESSLLYEVGNIISDIGNGIADSTAFKKGWTMDMFPFLSKYGTAVDRDRINTLKGSFAEGYIKYLENSESFSALCPHLASIYKVAEKIFEPGFAAA